MKRLLPLILLFSIQHAISMDDALSDHKPKETVQQTGQSTETLILACNGADNPELIQFLLTQGADVNAVDSKTGKTPFKIVLEKPEITEAGAAQDKRTQAIMLLAEKASNKTRAILYRQAIHSGRFLSACAIDPNSSLVSAVEKRVPANTITLLARKSNTQVKTAALLKATELEHWEALEALQAEGVNAQLPDSIMADGLDIFVEDTGKKVEKLASDTAGAVQKLGRDTADAAQSLWKQFTHLTVETVAQTAALFTNDDDGDDTAATTTVSPSTHSIPTQTHPLAEGAAAVDADAQAGMMQEVTEQETRKRAELIRRAQSTDRIQAEQAARARAEAMRREAINYAALHR